EAHRWSADQVATALLAGRAVQLVGHNGHATAHRTVGENASIRSKGALRRKRVGAGPISDRAEPFGRRYDIEPDPNNQVVGRHAGKIDTGEMARHAVATVGADEIFSRQI